MIVLTNSQPMTAHKIVLLATPTVCTVKTQPLSALFVEVKTE
jgi:hypothetical protein